MRSNHANPPRPGVIQGLETVPAESGHVDDDAIRRMGLHPERNQRNVIPGEITVAAPGEAGHVVSGVDFAVLHRVVESGEVAIGEFPFVGERIPLEQQRFAARGLKPGNQQQGQFGVIGADPVFDPLREQRDRAAGLAHQMIVTQEHSHLVADFENPLLLERVDRPDNGGAGQPHGADQRRLRRQLVTDLELRVKDMAEQLLAGQFHLPSEFVRFAHRQIPR